MWSLLFIVLTAALHNALACSRVPQGTAAAKSPVDESYVVSIDGNPETYVPGQRYNVSLTAHNGQSFISFLLALENENGINDMNSLGSFEINDLAETRFSPRCAHLVENTNTNMKLRVDVTWIAPASTGMGCILIRATVTQHRDVWFMDDGFLTKRICEEEIDDIDMQPTILDGCCACDEAKYELQFEGKWSRHTHPKDFPADSWRTRFSDIIGASHTIDYRFWKYGELASEGVREIAQQGTTRILESELKDQSEKIRTIIKARGIAHPNVTGKTFAVFRVDSKHHLISLVSMVYPSPDWIVGVSGLELCLPNCSWVESKEHNLYPWDAGTDSGPSYMSADQPQVPPDVIRRIKSNFPNDPRSPFYDPSGAQMKPLATLHIIRRRLYEKSCENSATDSDNNQAECAVTSWGPWDDCNVQCGSGKRHRRREYKDPDAAQRANCSIRLEGQEKCVGDNCDNIDANVAPFESDSQVAECALKEWTEWTLCDKKCGIGTQFRTRSYLKRRVKNKCQLASWKPLKETRNCNATDCGGEIGNGNGGNGNGNLGTNNNSNGDLPNDDMRSDERYVSARYSQFESFSQKSDDYIPDECGVSKWSDYSPCIGPCGGLGQRERLRKVWNYNKVYDIKLPNDDGSDPCENIKVHEAVNCTMPSCDTIVPNYCYEDLTVSPCRYSDLKHFWYYDHMSDQCAIFGADKCDKNRNKFKSREECEEQCRQPRHRQEIGTGPSVDCVVSKWQVHACNATCGQGVQIKTRRVLQSPRNGGKPCPKYLVGFENCFQRCDDIYSVDGGYGERRYDFKAHVKHHIPEGNDCRYSEWSAWTPCTASCGDNSFRQRTRTLLNTNFSYKCKDRVRMEKCVMLPCLLNSNDESDKW